MAIVIEVSPKVKLPKKLTLAVQTSSSGREELVILPHKNHTRKPNLILKVEKTVTNAIPMFRVEGSGCPSVDLAVKVPSLLLSIFRGVQITLQIPNEIEPSVLPLGISLEKNASFDSFFSVKVDGVMDLPQLIIKQGNNVLFKHWIPLAKKVVKKKEITGIQSFVLDKNGKCFYVYSSYAIDKACGVYLHKDLPRETPSFEGLVIGEKGISFKRSSHSRALKLSDVNLWDEILPYPDGFIGVSRNSEGYSQVRINGVYLIYQGAFDKVQAAPDGAVYVLYQGDLTKFTLQWSGSEKKDCGGISSQFFLINNHSFFHQE